MSLQREIEKNAEKAGALEVEVHRQKAEIAALRDRLARPRQKSLFIYADGKTQVHLPQRRHRVKLTFRIVAENSAYRVYVEH